MHLDPERAVFGGRRVRPGLALGVLAAALAGNLLGPAPWIPGVLAIAGTLALVAVAPRRLVGLAAFALLTLLVMTLAGAGGDASSLETLRNPAVRALAGAAWGLWFGAVVGWPSLKATLRRLGFPEDGLDFLDAALVHGLTLVSSFERRREAAFLRAGTARPARRLDLHGRVLATGVDVAFVRAVRLEEARSFRRATPGAGGEAGPVLSLASVSAEDDDGIRLLGPLDLRVARGEWLALAGPSGAGKTTLLRLLAGLWAPAAGECLRFGRRLEPGPLRHRLDGRVALVYQDPDDQLLGSTPLEDLIWGLRQRGLPAEAACERAEDLLESLGLLAVAHRSIHRLSFGERKRLAFAGALAGEPELLLCDEPTSGLDRVAAAQLVELLERAGRARPQLAVLWATHDLDHLPAGVGRVVMLGAGRITLDASPATARSPEVLRRLGLLPQETNDFLLHRGARP